MWNQPPLHRVQHQRLRATFRAGSRRAGGARSILSNSCTTNNRSLRARCDVISRNKLVLVDPFAYMESSMPGEVTDLIMLFSGCSAVGGLIQRHCSMWKAWQGPTGRAKANLPHIFPDSRLLWQSRKRREDEVVGSTNRVWRHGFAE